MDIQELRKRVKDTYDKLDSYSDEGTVSGGMIGDVSVHSFRTKFRKPDLLMFEWAIEDKQNMYTLKVKGKQAQLNAAGMFKDTPLYEKFGRPKDVVDVPMLCMLMAGTTHGLTDIILPLLIPNTGRSNLLSRKIAMLSDQDVDGEPCYQVREIYFANRIWISKRDYTIRKVEHDWSSTALDQAARFVLKADAIIGNLLPLVPGKREEKQAQLNSQSGYEFRFQKVEVDALDEESFPQFEFESVKEK